MFTQAPAVRVTNRKGGNDGIHHRGCTLRIDAAVDSWDVAVLTTAVRAHQPREERVIVRTIYSVVAVIITALMLALFTAALVGVIGFYVYSIF